MRVRIKQCETRPFQGAAESYRLESAAIPAEDWPCHTEDVVYGVHDVQFRGHYEARRTFPPSDEAVQALIERHLLG